MTLRCAVCMYDPTVPPDLQRSAVTVVNGWASCHDHLGYVTQGADFRRVVGLLHEKAAQVR